MPVKEHLSMQCAQFLANTYQNHHPSHEVTHRPPGDRPSMKPTLQKVFGPVVEKFADSDVLSQLAYKRVNKSMQCPCP
jgi:hypothetical protein